MARVALRRQLFLLALAGILPLAILAAVGLYLVFQEQRDVAQRRALEITRALGTAVGAQLDDTVSSLRLLAASRSLRADDLASFDEMARAALATQKDWNAVILADREGRELVNTRYPHGAALPRLMEPESFAQTVRAGRVIVGRLAKGPLGDYAFPVRVPIVEKGDVTQVLTAAVRPEAIRAIVDRQRVPETWVISVFDSAGLRVARSKSDQRYIGTRGAEPLRVLMSNPANEGTGITRTLEGDEVFTAYVRLPDSGWTVAMGLPVRAVTQAAIRSVAVYSIAVALSLLAGIFAVYLVARRVHRDIDRLREAADALGRGGEVAPIESHIAEIQEVDDAIVSASRLRRAFAAQREELLRREQAARGEAEEASRAKDQFLAMLAHELRNPLAALSNAAHLLGRDRADPQAATRVRDVIQRQVSHLARLTDDLLEAARALLGKIELRRHPVDLARIVGQTLETLRATGRTADHRIETDLAEAWVDGDEVRLEQVASNLLVNAVKYTPRGGTIHVATRRDAGDAVLTVADTGIGLSPELAARAFDLFVQGERSIERAQGGLGVGLTLVKRLAELHGGTVSVASEGENRGSEFTVRLPAMERTAVAQEAPQASAAKPHRILIVEDNEDARETLRAMLETLGHRVESAQDGIEGLRKALETPLDAALVDLGLPGMDGYELARRVRAAARPGRIRLFALSGYGSADDRARALAAGFDAHLTKPLDVGVLNELLSLGSS